MNYNKHNISLRQRAELLLKNQEKSLQIPDNKEEMQAMLRELQLQKIELELENQALLEANDLFLQNEQQFKNLIESISDFIGHFELDGTIRYINRIREGVLMDEVVGTKFQNFMPDEASVARIEAAFEQVANGEITEFIHRSKPNEKGEQGMFRSIFSPLRNSKGEICGITSRATDITVQYQKEEKAKAMQFLLEKTQEIGQIGSWELDLISQKVTWTKETYHIFDFSMDEPPTFDDFIAVVHPEDRAKVEEAWALALENKINYDVEYRFIINGVTKWARAKATTSYDENGKGLKLVGFTQDITSFKKAEEKLLRSEEYLQHGARIAQFGFWKLYPKNYKVEATKELLDIFELKEEVTYKNFGKYIHPDDYALDNYYFDRGMNEGEAWDVQYRLKFEDDRIKWIRVIGEPFLDATGQVEYIIGAVQDITKEKLVEIQIKESENRFRLIGEHINEVFYLFNLKINCYEYISPGCKSILGEDPDYFYEGGIYTLSPNHPEDQTARLRAVKCIKEGGDYDIEFRVIIHGEEVWLREKGFPIFDKDGNLAKVSGIVQNITTNKRQAEALRISKEQFERFFEVSPNFMFKTRLEDLKFMDANQRACEFYGYSKEEFQALYVHDLQTKGYVSDAIKERYVNLPWGEVVEMEGYHKKKDGTIFPVSISFCKLDDEYVLATGRDITIQKATNKKIEDLTYALNEAALVAITDDRGIILSVNDKFCEACKLTKSEIIGQTYRLFISRNHSLEFWDNLQETITSGKVWTGDIKNTAKDGKDYWLRTSMIPFLDEHGVPFQYIAIGTDITAQKQLEEDLRDAQKEAVRNAEIKENFLANMSHEIRTPMNGVLGFSRLLLQMDMTATQEKYAQSIYSSAESLLSVINDILDVSKMESGKFKIKHVTFNLAEKIENTLSILQVTIAQKKLALKVSIDPNIAPFVVSAPNRIAQILINLIGNAIKFTEEGHIELHVSVKNEDFLIFEVKDTGIGIPENKIETIFDTFTQVENYRTREYSGTGLGLSISKELVELMGGEIAVSSTVNEGSVFSFTLPYVPGKGEASEDLVLYTDEHQPISFLKGIRILLVEDHPVNQELAIIYLKLLQCEFDLAENGEEAIAMTLENTYDLILMDIQMPKMDGMEATRQIRLNQNQTPIIAMTAHALDKEMQKCLDIGMNDYLTKPFRVENLRTLIYKYIQKVDVLPETDASQNMPEQEPDNSRFAELLEDMGGDTELVQELLVVFREELLLFADNLEQAIDAEDFDQIRELRHQMKPSFEMFRFQQEMDYINTIVALCKNNDSIKAVRKIFTQFKASVPHILAVIDAELA